MDKQAPLSAERQRLLAQRLKRPAAPQNETPQIPKRPAAGNAPLSFAQYPLWVIDQITPGNTAYNLPVAYRISGSLDRQVLEDCFNTVIGRHEILRTTFREVDDDAIQEIRPECRIRVEAIDLTHLPLADREQEAKKLAAQEGSKPFDLRNLPLVRCALFILAEREQILWINLHHIIADGVSVNLLLEELDTLYRGAIAHSDPQTPELTVQFADFAVWQKAELAKPCYGAQLDYWRRQLGHELPLLEFGGKKPALHRQSFHGSTEDIQISKATIQALTSIGSREQCTLFVTILAAVQTILWRYSQAEEIIIGTPIANRPVPELDRLLGNFVNMVALRCDISGSPSFPELLRRSKDTMFNALSNKDIPFGLLVKDLRSHHNPAHNPVFQVLLQVLPAGLTSFGNLPIERFDFELRATQTDLALHLYQQSDGSILGKVQYCADLFAARLIKNFARNFVQLLDEIAKNPTRQILDFPLAEWPSGPAAEPTEATPVAIATTSPPAECYAAPKISIQSQLVEIWEEVLHRHPIGIHDDFFELGGHSLLVARMLAMVEDRLGVRLSFSSFFVKATIESMASLMQDRQRVAAQNHSWVLLNGNGTKRPLFFLHGDVNGGGFFCRALARSSDEDRPFYAIHPPGLHGDPVPTTIEDIAALQLPELRKIQPKGPYLLGGYCNGALVAYEMARRIAREDGECPVVIMLMAPEDGISFRYLHRLTAVVSAFSGEDAQMGQRRFLRWRETYLFLRGVRDHYLKAAADLVRQPPLEQLRRLFRKSKRVLLRVFGKRPSSREVPKPPPTPEVFSTGFNQARTDAYTRTVASYVPGRFGGRIVLLWPQEEKSELPQGPAHGWTKICADVRLVLVPGEHDSCVERDPNLREIGRQIARALAEIESHDQTKSAANSNPAS